MNYFWIIGSITGLICVYKGYHYGKYKLYEYVVQKVNEKLDEKLKQEESEELFKPLHKNSSAVIKVKHGGKTNSIYVPYDRRKSTYMLGKKVFLIKDEEKIDISQKPGIPYLICASELGGENIIVEDLSGNFIKSYLKDEIPRYL